MGNISLILGSRSTLSVMLNPVSAFCMKAETLKGSELSAMHYSRRQFNRLALAGLSAAAATSFTPVSALADQKPNSKFGSVQIGLNTGFADLQCKVDSLTCPRIHQEVIALGSLEACASTLTWYFPT